MFFAFESLFIQFHFYCVRLIFVYCLRCIDTLSVQQPEKNPTDRIVCLQTKAQEKQRKITQLLYVQLKNTNVIRYFTSSLFARTTSIENTLFFFAFRSLCLNFLMWRARVCVYVCLCVVRWFYNGDTWISFSVTFSPHTWIHWRIEKCSPSIFLPNCRTIHLILIPT